MKSFSFLCHFSRFKVDGRAFPYDLCINWEFIVSLNNMIRLCFCLWWRFFSFSSRSFFSPHRYPLDVVKTRAQLAVGKAGGPKFVSTLFWDLFPFLLSFSLIFHLLHSLFSTLASMIRNDGFGIYRGILPPILVEAPKRAVKFAANERYQPLFRYHSPPLETSLDVCLFVSWYSLHGDYYNYWVYTSFFFLLYAMNSFCYFLGW